MVDMPNAWCKGERTDTGKGKEHKDAYRGLAGDLQGTYRGLTGYQQGT